MKNNKCFYATLTTHIFLLSKGIAVKESAKVQKTVAKGVDDLDFYIGDDANDKPNYAVKVSFILGFSLPGILSSGWRKRFLRAQSFHRFLVVWNGL